MRKQHCCVAQTDLICAKMVERKYSSSKRRLIQRAEEKEAKDARLNNAAAWCRAHNKRAADAAKEGLIQMSQERTLRNMLSGRRKLVEQKQTRILTDLEETELVEWCIFQNESLQQPVRVKDLSFQVKLILALREEVNQDESTLHCKVALNPAAQRILHDDKSVSNSFCRSFLARHRNILAFEKESGIEEQRARWATRGVWRKHYRDLKHVLKLIKGEDGRIFPNQLANLDEWPSTIDGTQLASSFGRKGAARLRSKADHSENISYCPCYLMSGKALIHQVIIRAVGYEEGAATRTQEFVHGRHVPEIPKRLLQSLQQHAPVIFDFADKSCETGLTFTRLLHGLIKALNDQGISHTPELPFVLMLDGHKSHINVDALRLAKEAHIRMFFIPPHTSHIYQPLDRRYRTFHKRYEHHAEAWQHAKQSKDNLRRLPAMTRTGAVVSILRCVNEEWLSSEQCRAAFAECGVSVRGVNPEVVLGKLIPEEQDEPAATSGSDHTRSSSVASDDSSCIDDVMTLIRSGTSSVDHIVNAMVLNPPRLLGETTAAYTKRRMSIAHKYIRHITESQLTPRQAGLLSIARFVDAMEDVQETEEQSAQQPCKFYGDVLGTEELLAHLSEKQAVAQQKQQQQAEKEAQEGPVIDCMRMLGYFGNTPRTKCRITVKLLLLFIEFNCSPDVLVLMKRKQRSDVMAFVTRVVLKHGATKLTGPSSNSCAQSVGGSVPLPQ
eukprot:m.45351 g.45351  ORF g.45351 m.45351 type:complete len:724 (+) comp10876_c0_seq1:236-2407(+)